MNELQRELGRHALGLPTRNRTSYRNHFVAGPGQADYAEWVRMVEQGDAKSLGQNVLWGGTDTLFKLTRAGAEKCLDPREKLCEEDFPK